MSNTTSSDAMHPFEAAGLGKAPFRFIGYEESVFQAIPGDPNCPVQAGSSCDCCPASIRHVYWIRSSDGRKFKVGCDCVRKTGDVKLVKAAEAKARAVKARADKARKAAKISAAEANLGAAADVLKARPHPNKFQASKGATMYDYVAWLLQNAGNSGKLRAAKIIAEVA